MQFHPRNSRSRGPWMLAVVIRTIGTRSPAESRARALGCQRGCVGWRYSLALLRRTVWLGRPGVQKGGLVPETTRYVIRVRQRVSRAKSV